MMRISLSLHLQSHRLLANFCDESFCFALGNVTSAFKLIFQLSAFDQNTRFTEKTLLQNLLANPVFGDDLNTKSYSECH